jgi:hypothetical protein
MEWWKTHPLSPSLCKRGGIKGGEFKEFVGFFRDIDIKYFILACMFHTSLFFNNSSGAEPFLNML